jgi:hypothetical protein
MPTSTAERWLRAGVPGWVPGALAVGWTAALVAAVAGDTTPPCSPADPSICGPDQVFAWAVVVLFATPVLLWWQPLAGCAAGIAFAVLDLAFDAVRPANVAFGAYGLLCLAAAVWMVRARRRQREVASRPGLSRGRLPAVAFSERWGPRLLACVGFLGAGAGLLGLYAHLVAGEQRHLDRAVQTQAQVVAVDDEDSTITVGTPPAGRHRLGVMDSTIYPQGSTVALWLDPADPRWARLVAEPSDSTGWESAGLGCLALAALLGWRELAARRARRRLLAGEHPVLEVLVQPDLEGNALVFPADVVARGAAGRPLAVMAVHWSSADPEGGLPADDDSIDGAPDAREVAAFGRVWRGEADGDDVLGREGGSPLGRLEPEPAAVVGEFVEGGWAAIVTDHELVLPQSPLRLRRQRLGVPWRRQAGVLRLDRDADEDVEDVADLGELPGRPVTADPQIDTPPLPHVLAPPQRQRLTGLAMLLGMVAAAISLAAGLAQDWYEHVLLIGFGVWFTYGGLVRLARRVTLTRLRFTVTTGVRNVHVPWERFHGARVGHKHLYLAFEPDLVVQVGPFEAAGPSRQRRRDVRQVAALMMALRARALAAGSAGRPVRSTAGPVIPGLAIYALLVIASLWWRLRHG